MVRILTKLAIGTIFAIILFIGFSFVKSNVAQACENSGVYGCLNVHVRDGISGGGLAGATVTVEIGPLKPGGFYCLTPGRSNTTITTTTNSYGDATVDNICCTAVVEYVIVTISKPGYLTWGPYYIDLPNAPEFPPTDLDVPLTPETPKDLNVNFVCEGSGNTVTASVSWTADPSQTGLWIDMPFDGTLDRVISISPTQTSASVTGLPENSQGRFAIISSTKGVIADKTVNSLDCPGAPPAGSVSVVYTCTSSTRVSAKLNWKAGSGQDTVWVDIGADGSPLPPERQVSISSSQTSLTVSNLPDNDKHKFAVLDLSPGPAKIIAVTAASAQNCPSPPPPPDDGSAIINVFEDTGSLGYDSESTLSTSSAPKTVVRWNSATAGNETFGGSLTVDKDPVNPGMYIVYFLPDSGWEITKYAVREPGGSYVNATYLTASGMFRTNSFRILASEATRIKLGIKRTGSGPNLVAEDLAAQGLSEEDAPLSFTGTIRNYLSSMVAGASQARFRLAINSDLDPDPTNPIWDIVFDLNDVASLPVKGYQFVASLPPKSPWTAVIGTHTIELCADVGNKVTETDETDNCQIASFPIGKALAKPWLVTRWGDVGAVGDISMTQEILPSVNSALRYNAFYLVINKTNLLEKFTSAKGWLVPNYNPLNLTGPEYKASIPGFDYYEWLHKKLESRGIKDWTDKDLMPPCNDPSGCVYQYKETSPGKPDLVIDKFDINCAAAVCTEPIVYFVSGSLHLNNDMLDNKRPIIWVVGGDVRSNVTHVPDVLPKAICNMLGMDPAGVTNNCDFPVRILRGFYFVNGTFHTTNPGGMTILTGSVAANAFDLRSNIGKNDSALNSEVPSELIGYDPWILYYFRELLGMAKVSFKEVVP